MIDYSKYPGSASRPAIRHRLEVRRLAALECVDRERTALVFGEHVGPPCGKCAACVAASAARAELMGGRA